MSNWQVTWPMSKMALIVVDDRHHEHKASLNTFRTLHPIGLIRLFLWPLHHCPLLMCMGTHFYFALEKPWKRHHVTLTAWCTRRVSRQIHIFLKQEPGACMKTAWSQKLSVSSIHQKEFLSAMQYQFRGKMGRFSEKLYFERVWYYNNKDILLVL